MKRVGGSGHGAIAYLAVASVQRGATLLALPLFALALSPLEYGQIALLIALYGLMTLVLPSGLDAAVFRANFSLESPKRQKTYISTLITTLFVIPSLLSVIVGVVVSMGPSVGGLEPQHLGLYIATAGISTSATVGPLALLRATERFGSYALLTLAYAGIQITLRILFVVVHEMGVRGWVLADFMAAVFALLLSIHWQRAHLSLSHFRKNDLRSGLRMGLPLVPHLAAHWALNLSDRLVLAAFWTPAVVGVYSMGYQIAFVAGMAVTELSRAFMPRYGEAAADGEAGDLLSEHIKRQVLATVVVTAGVSLIGPQLVYAVLPESYSGAAGLIPWVALGFTFFGFYCIPMNLIAIVAGRTDGVWMLTIAAGGANLGANLLLIPRFGPTAAAVNTSLGNLVLLVLVSRMARLRCKTVRLDVRPYLGVVLLAIALAAGGSLLSVRRGVLGFAGSGLAGALVLLVVGFGLRRRPDSVQLSPALSGDFRA